MSAKPEFNLRLPISREPPPGPPTLSDDDYARWVSTTRRRLLETNPEPPRCMPVPVRFELRSELPGR